MLDSNSIRILFLFLPGIVAISLIQGFSSKKNKLNSTEILMYSFVLGVLSYLIAYFFSWGAKSLYLALFRPQKEKITLIFNSETIITLNPKEITKTLIISAFLSLAVGFALAKKIKKLEKIKMNIDLIRMWIFMMLSIILSPIIAKFYSFQNLYDFIFSNPMLYILFWGIYWRGTYFFVRLLALFISKIKLGFKIIIGAFSSILGFVLIGWLFSKFNVEHLKFHEILVGILNNKAPEITIWVLTLPSLIGLILGIIFIIIRKKGFLNKEFFKSKVSYDGLGDLKNSTVKIKMNDNSKTYFGKITFFEFHENQIEILLENARVISENKENTYSNETIYLTLLHGTYHIEKKNKSKIIKIKKLITSK